jgi:hypothetical protein
MSLGLRVLVKVQGLRYRIWDLGFMVQGLGCRV